MGIFKELFGTKKASKQINNTAGSEYTWYKLKKIEQLEAIRELSNEKLVVIFKHSTRCGISKMVWNQFHTYADFDEDNVALFYLDLLSYRDVSDQIAADFQVIHQSPQLLLIKNGEVVHYSSHSSISPSVVSSFLD
ncbi:MAG: bacillithiol system redox-active protein YtxJ [Bacteroidota bacterium]